MVGLALFGAMIFYLELEVVLTLPVKTINATPTPGYLYANLYASLYAGVFLCVGILFREGWGRDIILGEYWCEMGEVWAPPPRYTKTATLPPVSITNRGRIGGDSAS